MHISQPFRFTQDQSLDLSAYTESFSAFRVRVHPSMTLAVKNISVANHLTAAGEVVSTPVNLAVILGDRLEDMVASWVNDLALDVETGIGDTTAPIAPGWTPPDSTVLIGEPHMVVVREAPVAAWPVASACGLVLAHDRLAVISAQSTITIPSEILGNYNAEYLYLIPFLDSLKSQPIVTAGRMVFDLLYITEDGAILYGEGGR